jgi:TPR repeat protein
MSAEQGNPMSEFPESGRRVYENLTEAARYLKMAADRDRSEAQRESGRKRFIRKGLEKNSVEVERSAKRTAENGNFGSRYFYGSLLTIEKLTERIYLESVRDFKFGAERDHRNTFTAPADFTDTALKEICVRPTLHWIFD